VSRTRWCSPPLKSDLAAGLGVAVLLWVLFFFDMPVTSPTSRSGRMPFYPVGRGVGRGQLCARVIRIPSDALELASPLASFGGLVAAMADTASAYRFSILRRWAFPTVSTCAPMYSSTSLSVCMCAPDGLPLLVVSSIIVDLLVLRASRRK